MKHLLIVFHSQTGHTRALAEAVARGATSEEIEGVTTRLLRAGEAGVEDLLWAHALVLGTTRVGKTRLAEVLIAWALALLLLTRHHANIREFLAERGSAT